MVTLLQRIRQIPRRYVWLAPAVAILALLVITVFVYHDVRWYADNWTHQVKRTPSTPEASRLIALVWATAAILFATITAGAVVVIGACIYGSLFVDRSRLRWEVIAVTLIAIGCLLAVALLPQSPLGTEPYITAEILDVALLPSTRRIVDILWTATIIAALFVAVGTSSSLVEPPRTIDVDDDPIVNRVRHLREQTRRLHIVLYAGAAVLVAGVLELDALYQWAVSLTNLHTDSDAARVIAGSATVPTGTFFSLFLAAAYLPAAAVLRSRATSLAQNRTTANTAVDQRDWLVENGLATSIPTNIASIVALLGPAFAGGPLNALAQVLG